MPVNLLDKQRRIWQQLIMTADPPLEAAGLVSRTQTNLCDLPANMSVFKSLYT